VTSTQVMQDLAVGIRAVYEIPAEAALADYPVDLVAEHLAAINTAWGACFAIASNREP